MNLPNVFAVYRRDTCSFQLLQLEENERLKCWSRPYADQWKNASEEEKERYANWFRGQDWYVVPSETGVGIHAITIHEKEYSWWHLGYDLVWTNSGVFNERHSAGTKAFWESSPRIPVVEFNTKRIYPRAETGFYPRWILGKQQEVYQKSELMWEIYLEGIKALNSKHVEPSDLRIRTPRAGADENEDESENSWLVADRLEDESGSRFLSLCCLSGLLVSVFGLYGYIGACFS
jgi:hypothetical protein